MFKQLFTKSSVLLTKRECTLINGDQLENVPKIIDNCCKLITTKRNSRVIRRKITRIPTDFEVGLEEIESNKLSNNDNHLQCIKNRNPRNLEQMLFEQKPLGWELESISKSYWNKIEFIKKGKYLVGQILHNSGRILFSVSSNDKSFKDHCDSKNDINAAKCIGQILARKCLESGILYVFSSLPPEQYNSLKVKAFIDTVRENGLLLKEPEFIFPRRSRDL